MRSNGEGPNPRSDQPASIVLYCLLRSKKPDERRARFYMIRKQGYMTFPPTRFRPGENLYSALVRPLEEDLGLPSESYYPEEELEMIPNEGETKRYEGLSKKWYLYPVDVSLNAAAWPVLERSSADASWWTLDDILEKAEEPNVRAIARHIRNERSDLANRAHDSPSMDALACHWSAHHEGGVRVVQGREIQKILEAGERAFNLRVADPYLPYQKQGLGFTWSFFTPKDKQDVHVHGLPAVEIYGVMEGKLQLWHKPMNQRGVRTWRCETLGPGDWAEVEPLHCHFACWHEPSGLGTVIKAAASGELAGVGRLGEKGKTVCNHCSMQGQCALPPRMKELLDQYALPFGERDYSRIASLIRSTVL